MVVLACIVVACSARLEVLDLSLDSCSPVNKHLNEGYFANPYAQGLLVRPRVAFHPGRVPSGQVEDLLSCTAAQAIVCFLWQCAAALCEQLRSLHLSARGEDLLWPSHVANADWASVILLNRSGPEDICNEVDFADPWRTVAARRWAGSFFCQPSIKMSVRTASTSCPILLSSDSNWPEPAAAVQALIAVGWSYLRGAARDCWALRRGRDLPAPGRSRCQPDSLALLQRAIAAWNQKGRIPGCDFPRRAWARQVQVRDPLPLRSMEVDSKMAALCYAKLSAFTQPLL